MKLIDPRYKIITPIDENNYYNLCEYIARTCYKSGDKIKEGSATRLIKNLVKNEHLAMLECTHIIAVKFICDRAFSHELVRHRHCSFAQESQRYCKYEHQDMEFIKPYWYNEDNANIKDSSEYEYLQSCKKAEYAYKKLRENGLPAQGARSVLPNSVKTEIVCVANVREWRHILKLRTANDAHPDMQRLMRPLLADLIELLPLFFEDISY